jgi:hypothetical protein
VYSTQAISTSGVANDPTTKTYLTTDDANGILRLAENTVGTGPFMGQPEHLTPAPISVITSDTCGG